MASANFRIGYSSVSVTGPWTWGSYGAAVDISAGDWVKIDLESAAGIGSINVAIPRADETVLAAGVPAVTIDQVTRTATFKSTTGPLTYCVEVTGNPGTSSETTVALAVHILTSAGMRLLAYDETTESDPDYKWLAKINDMLRTGGSGYAASNSTFLTVGAQSSLTGSRALAGTAAQILGTDGGAGNSYTLSLIATAVTAGAYALASVTVDDYGRLTACSAATSIELPNGANRTFSVEATAGESGDDLMIYAGAGGAGEDDGRLYMKDPSGNIGFTVGNSGHGDTEAYISFYGETRVARQTVDYYNDEATDAGHAGTLALALLTALDALGLVNKNMLVT